jgi:SAM-dependent methyltransferase
MNAGAALDRWRADLKAWAIPQEILDRAPASPWVPERATFVRRAVARVARPAGNSYRRAREALPEGGAVIDIGAGAGAASLPLLGRAGSLVAVDQDEESLKELARLAGPNIYKVTTVVGAWPATAQSVPPADVVVCHHVLYNVPDLRPFIDAIEAHARRRAVIEITARHPLARLSPLWKRFHGLDRPTRPTWEDAVAAVEAARGPVHAEHERLEADPVASGEWDEIVANTTRRLCLDPSRAEEVAAALTELTGARPDDTATWSAANREVGTIWWDV